MKNEIVISSALRTPIGGFAGTLKDTPAAALGAELVKTLLQRNKLDAQRVSEVIIGNVLQAGNGMNIARQVAINGGLPVSVPAHTVNRVCGSGAQAVVSAYAQIRSGLSELVIAGGVENMDQAPYLMPALRHGARMGNAQALDALLRDGLNDAFSGQHSGWHTEDLAARYEVTREAQDRFAASSQQRFAAAQEAGWFDAEIVALTIASRKGEILFDKDEANRADTTEASLAKLKPAFRKDGSITAGNAPGLNAGAAAMLVSSAETAQNLGLQAQLVIRGIGIAAVEPGYFGYGPVPAIRQALAQAEWQVADVDRFEVNEAFAVVGLVVRDELGIAPERFNVDGGAIAHGHPIGATGAVLLTKLAHALQRTQQKKGVVSLCIGGGQGIAIAVERP